MSTSEASGYRIKTLDSEAARQNGISQETIDLASEAVAYHNVAASSASGSGVSDITQTDIGLSNHPRVNAYFNGQATGDVDDPNDPGIPDGAHLCGNKKYPVPNYSPARRKWRLINPSGG